MNKRALTTGNLPGLVICSGDDDYYAVTVATGERASFYAGFSHADDDLDMLLYSPRSFCVPIRSPRRLAKSSDA